MKILGNQLNEPLDTVTRVCNQCRTILEVKFEDTRVVKDRVWVGNIFLDYKCPVCHAEQSASWDGDPKIEIPELWRHLMYKKAKNIPDPKEWIESCIRPCK